MKPSAIQTANDRNAAQAKRYERALRWALGELGRFGTRQEGQGAFWWRHELQIRAGLRWDSKRRKFVSRENFKP